MKKLWLATVGVAAAAAIMASVALAAAPQNTSPPTISGKEMVGETLTGDVGKWDNNPSSYEYQWQRCNRDGSSCGNIAGANDKTYKLQDSDVGTTVRFTVLARNSDGSKTAFSKVSDVISGDSAPRNLERPTISGKPQVGETLTADVGRWAEGPTFRIQWQSCDKNGQNCKNITGATGMTYGVRASDVGNEIRVQVTGRNLVGSETATSNPTAAVTGATPQTTTTTPTPTPVGVGGALSVSAVALPDRLVISQVKFTPSVIRSRTEPIIARFKITETNAGRAVSGALVYALAVPSNRVSGRGEIATDQSGWATMTFQPMAGLPMKNGSRLTFFVRARKPGENPLAGVSTRRLVSVGVHPG